MGGCNFKCLNCQNWTISQFPDTDLGLRGYVDPVELARECVERLQSMKGRLIGADRIFFSGGEPTIHIPYIEKVVEEARRIDSEIKVNFDTNGYMTMDSLKRILDFTTSITYDLKAYRDELHLTLTGAPSGPVLRNAAVIAREAKDRIWEFRIVVIPKINEDEIQPLAAFIAEIDTSLPVCFLAFRPNFILEDHPGADKSLMERCIRISEDAGLTNVSWSGHTGIDGQTAPADEKIQKDYRIQGAWLSGSYALRGGCHTHPRACGNCPFNQRCQIKTYVPERVT
jgi:pyruvate formate lyase activating enzyme